MTPDIVALDNQYILQTYGRSSFVIERGDGCYLYDTTGTYAGALSVSVALGVFAAIVNLPVNERPLAERNAATAAA